MDSIFLQRGARVGGPIVLAILGPMLERGLRPAAGGMLSLTGLIPDPPRPDALYEAFVGWTERQGRQHPHQDEAVIELCSGSNVILATPTGSGKSMVAVAAHFTAMAEGRVTFTPRRPRRWFRRFFALCETFGAENVGMLTGDAAVNSGAPIICCTRRGAGQYPRAARGRRRRRGPGRDGRVPLLRRAGARLGVAGAAAEPAARAVLLMSATLGDVSRCART